MDREKLKKALLGGVTAILAITVVAIEIWILTSGWSSVSQPRSSTGLVKTLLIMVIVGIIVVISILAIGKYRGQKNTAGKEGDGTTAKDWWGKLNAKGIWVVPLWIAVVILTWMMHPKVFLTIWDKQGGFWGILLIALILIITAIFNAKWRNFFYFLNGVLVVIVLFAWLGREFELDVGSTVARATTARATDDRSGVIDIVVGQEWSREINEIPPYAYIDFFAKEGKIIEVSARDGRTDDNADGRIALSRDDSDTIYWPCRVRVRGKNLGPGETTVVKIHWQKYK